MRNALDAGAAGFEMDLVARCIALRTVAAAGILLDQDGENLGVPAEFTPSVEVTAHELGQLGPFGLAGRDNHAALRLCDVGRRHGR